MSSIGFAAGGGDGSGRGAILAWALVLALSAVGLGQQLSGKWRDSNGDVITIVQRGNQVRATPDSAKVRRYWTVGEATLNGGRMRMVHRLGSRTADVQTGALIGGNRIRWSNGSTWTRLATAVAPTPSPTPTPTPGPSPEVLEQERSVTLFPETYTVPKTYAPGALTYPAKVTFFNEGGYVARFKLTYYANGRVHTFKTGSMAFKERQQHVVVPASARNIYATGEYWNAGWNRLFRRKIELERRPYVMRNGQRVPDPVDRYTPVGFKSYDDAFTPEWNNKVEPWTPTFDGEVHVANKTGKPIYVGHCTDLTWSVANGATGIMMTLIDDVRNGRRNAVKYLAIAMAADIRLPRELVAIFRDVGIRLPNGDAKMVVETSVQDNLKALFDAATGPLETVLTTIAGNVANDPELTQKNITMNPIIAGANVFGARSLNLVIFNSDMSRYWIIPTTIDESWIIEGDRAYLAKRGTLRTRDPLGRSYPGVPTGYSIPSDDAAEVAASAGKKFSPPRRVWCEGFGRNNGWNSRDHTRVLADVDGDGRVDVVGFGAGGVLVGRSLGDRFERPRLVLRAFGKAQGWDASRLRFAQDVNGDGRADIVAFEGNTPFVALSKGLGFEAPVAWPLDLSGRTPGRDGRFDLRTVRRGGYEGKAYIWDFKKDVINTWLPYEGKFHLTHMASPRFVEASGWKGGPNQRLLGDVNGDGSTDVIGLAEKASIFGPKIVSVSVALTGNPASNVFGVTAQMDRFGQGFQSSSYALADVNGDGKADLIGFYGAGTFVALSRSNHHPSRAVGKNSVFEAAVLGIANFSGAMGWTGQRHLRLMGDVDGDGRADIVGFTDGGVVVALSRW